MASMAMAIELSFAGAPAGVDSPPRRLECLCLPELAVVSVAGALLVAPAVLAAVREADPSASADAPPAAACCGVALPALESTLAGGTPPAAVEALPAVAAAVEALRAVAAAEALPAVTVAEALLSGAARLSD